MPLKGLIITNRSLNYIELAAVRKYRNYCSDNLVIYSITGVGGTLILIAMYVCLSVCKNKFTIPLSTPFLALGPLFVYDNLGIMFLLFDPLL